MKKIFLLISILLITSLSICACESENIQKTEANTETQTSSDIKENTTEDISSEDTNNEYGDLKNFETKTFDEKTYATKDLADYDLTLVNFWGTYCKPCVKELPELSKLKAKLPENINLIGVCVDYEGNEDIAKKIVERTGIKLTNLICNDSINKSIADNIQYLPTSIIFDKEGNIVGDIISGSPDEVEKSFVDAINKALQSIGKEPISINLEGNSANNEYTSDSDEDSDENYEDYDDVYSYEDEGWMPPEALEDYAFSYDMSHISQEDMQNLKDKYKIIVDKYYNNEYEDYTTLYDDLAIIDNDLRKHDLYMPYYRLIDYLNNIENMTEEDKEFLLANENIIDPYSDQEYTDEDDETYDKIESILAGYNIDIVEMMSQYQNMNFNISIYDVKKDGFDQRDNLPNKDILSESEKTLLDDVNKQVKTLIPSSIWSMISSIEYNTDGKDEVLAHTLPDTDDFEDNQFRLALDLSDSIDSTGKLTVDGKETIVHETGHMITLQPSQAYALSWEGDGSEAIEERYKKDSYIMKFYELFWKDIIDEFTETSDAYTFYEDHAEMFVSDYAATNIEEDIAESFRVFVCGQKPETNTIADQKVKFFYSFPELVKIRDEYRDNL